jgi:ElaB/YqjD/DUF883 family membrane-anchored ribosome-binding protein
MIRELQKLHASTSNLTATFQSGVQESVHHQAASIQHGYAEFTAALSATVQNLSSIVKDKDLPVQEKISRVSKEVQNRVTPLLDTITKGASEVLARSKETTEAAEDVANGHPAESHE